MATTNAITTKSGVTRLQTVNAPDVVHISRKVTSSGTMAVTAFPLDSCAGLKRHRRTNRDRLFGQTVTKSSHLQNLFSFPGTVDYRSDDNLPFKLVLSRFVRILRSRTVGASRHAHSILTDDVDWAVRLNEPSREVI
jgi:hypothetical protein